MEDELQKKRAELREALRQDTIPIRSAPIHSPSDSIGSRGGSGHQGYRGHHLSGDIGHHSSGRVVGNHIGSVSRTQLPQTENNFRRHNHSHPQALTRAGVTLELLSPGRDEEMLDEDDQYRQRRDDSGAEVIRSGGSPIRGDIYMSSTSEYTSHRSSSSHQARSHNRHMRRTSGNETEHNHRSRSGGSNHRSRSGSRGDDNSLSKPITIRLKHLIPGLVI